MEPLSEQESPRSAKVQAQTALRSKVRSGFNLAKDLFLLRTSLNLNPWQLGDDKWETVKVDFNKEFESKITERSAKDRVKLLIKKYKDETFSTKTGTEQERTDRGDLILEIIGLIEAEKVPIEIERGASEELESREDENSKKRKARAERKEADEDRTRVFENFFESTPEPTGIRRKRSKLSIEDEMIKQKQEHDMRMEVERLELDKKTQERNSDLEQRRLNIERDRIMLEERREERIEAENKRNNDLMTMFCEIVKKVIEKQ